MLNVGSCQSKGNVWTFENRISSDGNVQEVCLPGLLDGARELIGILVKVDGKTKLNGIFRYAPFKPGTKVTTDGFDQTVLYHTLHNVPLYLMKMGFNIPEVIAKKRGTAFKITGHANGTDALNAWYSPQSGQMTFGTNSDKWHLASDSDVSAHEEGHLILDHYHPGLVGRYVLEGGAIHEGFADIIAAGYFNDPHMSEDFAPMKGRPESKNDGLRIVDNQYVLDEKVTQVHTRGKVYSGFFWSIKKALEDPNGPFKLTPRQSADLMLKLAMNHAGNYRTSRPTSKDFVDAVLTGMVALASQGQLGVNPDALGQIITKEAIFRKMITDPNQTKPPVKEFRSLQAAKHYFSQKSSGITGFIKVHEASFIGGTYEIHRQVIASKLFGTIEIVGRGIHIQRDIRGNIVSLSTKDVIELSPEKIDESGKVTIQKALDLALGKAEIEYQKTRYTLQNFRMLPIKKTMESFKGTQMEFDVSRIDLANLRRMKSFVMSGNKLNTKVVLIDDSNIPQYEFKVGLSIYYVNTKTGEVTKHKDVLVN